MGIRLTGTSWLIACVAVAGVAFLAERLLEPGAGGSLLITMAVFLGLAEGALGIALADGLSAAHGIDVNPVVPRLAGFQEPALHLRA